MRHRFGVLLVAATAVCTAILAAVPAQAQSYDTGQCPTPWFQRRCWPFMPWSAPSNPAPSVAPSTEPTPTPAPGTTPTPPLTPSTAPSEMPSIAAFGNEAGGAIGGGNAAFASSSISPAAGYLDNPIPTTTFRLRYDSQSDFNRFDRAGYFYAPWQELSFHQHPIVNASGQLVGVLPADPHANGFPQLSGRLDQQVEENYFEYATSNRFSVFVTVPFRFVHTSRPLEDPDMGNLLANGKFNRDFKDFPEPGGGADNDIETYQNNTGGLGDIDFGFKAAMIATDTRYLTFQFRTYVPTGVPSIGLGTGHVSLEPSLLFYQQLTQRLTFQAQVDITVPLGNQPTDGNVVNWGLGFGYDVYRNGNFKITPTVEVEGWDVLSGAESVFQPIPVPANLFMALPNTHGIQSAAGDTIINSMLGTRVYWGKGSSMFLGWGHCLTADRWYRDDIRVEYRMLF